MVTRSSMVPKTVLETVGGSMHGLRANVKRHPSRPPTGGCRARGRGGESLGVIGVLREGPLHRALKAWLAGPGDRFEVHVDGFVIDLVRADGELVEIQTGGFSPLRTKLDTLLDHHRIRI